MDVQVEMIRDAGFEGREHKVVTPDGYILTVHRLHRLHTEHSNPGPVVFLQHGLFSSSADWVIGHRSKAFGELRDLRSAQPSESLLFRLPPG